MYLIKTGEHQITDLESGALFVRHIGENVWIERVLTNSEYAPYQIIGDSADEIAARIWQHLESLCKFDATKEAAPKPEPTARYAPLDNPKVGDTVYPIFLLERGEVRAHTIHAIDDANKLIIATTEDGGGYGGYPFSDFTRIPF